MIVAILVAGVLQAGSGDGLAEEGRNLGRYSTLFALCEPYYGIDIDVGRRLSDAFEVRASAAAWTDQRISAAYAEGQSLERADLGIALDTSGVTPREARRTLRTMLARLKARCGDLATAAPGAVGDVPAGDARIDATLRSLR